MTLIPELPPQAVESVSPAPAGGEDLVGWVLVTHGQLRQLATLHRSLRFATATADALMPNPGDDPFAMVDRDEIIRWVEAVTEAVMAYEALQKYRCDIGWPTS